MRAIDARLSIEIRRTEFELVRALSVTSNKGSAKNIPSNQASNRQKAPSKDKSTTKGTKTLGRRAAQGSTAREANPATRAVAVKFGRIHIQMQSGIAIRTQATRVNTRERVSENRKNPSSEVPTITSAYHGIEGAYPYRLLKTRPRVLEMKTRLESGVPV